MTSQVEVNGRPQENGPRVEQGKKKKTIKKVQKQLRCSTINVVGMI
jgi:hypothetical protein